ncbi:hypothetical protein CH373_14415 [Leptospira perolatii]|uniref:Uncharacterized protein n=1 Tax=Leptospira perolatii TaxID=2023191 RepID=A0A2M9ZJX2_9LEPT|nr:hypothetical protein CH360_12205 [Leptospira perolatii]PJZ72349.1 hypothetical protein CH373_14415 [Leptospira perolatii]
MIYIQRQSEFCKRKKYSRRNFFPKLANGTNATDFPDKRRNYTTTPFQRNLFRDSNVLGRVPTRSGQLGIA